MNIGKTATTIIGFLILAGAGVFVLYDKTSLLAPLAPQGTFLPAVHVGDAVVNVYTAKTQDEQTKGLSIFNSLPSAEGMLFIFPKDGRYGIWMKDMKFPIDIIWIDASGHIVDIVKGATPASYPTVFYPQGTARYVLEVPAGFVAAHNTTASDIVDISAAL